MADTWTCYCGGDETGHALHKGPHPCYCGDSKEPHTHLLLPDPPGTTRLEIIKRKLDSDRKDPWWTNLSI